MTEHGSDKEQHGHTEILPASLDFSSLRNSETADSDVQHQESARQRGLIAGICVLGLALTALVLFPDSLLPSEDEPSAATPLTQNTTTNPGQAVPTAIGEQGSPWSDAQLARQRELAQKTLEQLLDAQFSLQERGVESWAEAAYSNITARAISGDEHYRGRRFRESNEDFSAALVEAQTLLAGLPARLAGLLSEARLAVTEYRQADAQRLYETIVLIEPEHEAALAELPRVAKIPELAAQLAIADAAQNEQRYPDALRAIEQMISLDPERQGLDERRTLLVAEIVEGQFVQSMSEGYRWLDSGARQNAQQSFNKALALKPGAPEALAALKQLSSQQALDQMAEHYRRAAQAESVEDWAGAVKAYSAALLLDPNLAEAQKKKSYAQQREKMATAIQTLNRDPLRLADAGIYQKALRIRAAAAAINNKGPKHQRQTAQLETHLRLAQTAANVFVRSDGLTKVTIQRVQALGNVDSTRLSLKPGRYTAIGVRQGYRDVRKEFVVPQGAKNVEVEIRCEQTI